MSELHNLRPTRAIVDLDAISGNVRAIEARVQVPVMAVIKADAYGHGLVPVAQHLQARGVGQFAVAFVEEGIALRQAGITVPILVLGGIPVAQVPQLLDDGLDITVPSMAMLQAVDAAAAARGVRAVIHLKVDTGMGRLGVPSAHSGAFIEAALAARHCEIKAIYSHLACADDPASPMTLRQLARFHDACAHFDRLGAPMPLRHLANSGGVLHFPDTWLDMVRPGIMLYGVLPDPGARRTVPIRPGLRLVSQVAFAKTVPAGQTISYGATWTAPRETCVATVPIGYGDGYPRALSNCGKVLIHGRYRPIVGRVCMDQFVVDVGNAGDVHVGDEVVLIGTQDGASLTADDVGTLAGSFGYEVLTRIKARVPRDYPAATDAR